MAASGQTPSFEDLEAHAKAVYRTFCTHHAAERALDPVADVTDDDSDGEEGVEVSVSEFRSRSEAS